MTVAELIAALQQHDPAARVEAVSDCPQIRVEAFPDLGLVEIGGQTATGGGTSSRG